MDNVTQYKKATNWGLRLCIHTLQFLWISFTSLSEIFPSDTGDKPHESLELQEFLSLTDLNFQTLIS